MVDLSMAMLNCQRVEPKFIDFYTSLKGKKNHVAKFIDFYTFIQVAIK